MIKIYTNHEEFEDGPLGKYIWFGTSPAPNEIRYKTSSDPYAFKKLEFIDGTVKNDQDL